MKLSGGFGKTRKAALPNNHMTKEEEYYAGEFTDEFLHSQADAGDHHLQESGWSYMPSNKELERMVADGEAALIIQGWIKANFGIQA